MSFANPMLLLIGGGLLGLPILLHLIMQQKPRSHVFPALRFVQERLSSNQRKLRVRHWILLLLRCIGIFIVAMAFAMPSSSTYQFGAYLTLGVLGFVGLLALLVLIATVTLNRTGNKILLAVNGVVVVLTVASMAFVYSSFIGKEAGTSLGNDQSPVSAVVLIDTSPRMLYEFARENQKGVWESKSRLAEAREMADWLIRELPNGSDVAIVDTNGSDPFFSVDIAAAAKRISSLQVSWNSQPLVERVESSLEFLDSTREEKQKPLEIYVFSDLTLESWKSKRQKSVRERLAQANDISVYLVDVSVENPTNYQMDDLELSSETASIGGAFNITARVFRLGPAGERPVHLYLDRVDPGKPVYQDGKTVLPAQQLVRMAALQFEENDVQQAGFTLKNLPTGIHHGVVKIEGNDSLAADNQRYFTVEVRNPQKVLLVRPGQNDNSQTEVVSRHVEIVLAPDELVDSGQAAFEVTTVDQSRLLEQKLSQYSAIFLLDPVGLSSLEWTTLKKFVIAGGGLAIILGENAKTTLGPDPSFHTPEALEVLGGKLGEVWTPTEAFVSILDYSHPLVQKFRKFETDDVWRDFPVYQHWGLEIPGNDSSIQLVARYSTGQPAIVSKKLGEGTAVVITTSLTQAGQLAGRKRWNDLTTGEWWPAAMLIDELAKVLVANQFNRLNYRVGKNVVLHEDPQGELDRFLMFPPRDEEPSEITIENDKIRYRFTDSAGSYRLKPIGSVSNRRGFSANIQRGQTDLLQVDEKVLDSILGKNRYKMAKSRQEIIRQQSYVREGKKFFSLLITVFGVIMVMEFVMSNRFYRGL